MYVIKCYMKKLLQGDIATCAATWLHVWSINGEELASVNTCVGRADRMQQILCVAFSQTHEWDSQNVIMTGSTDGVARVRYNTISISLKYFNTRNFIKKYFPILRQTTKQFVYRCGQWITCKCLQRKKSLKK